MLLHTSLAAFHIQVNIFLKELIECICNSTGQIQRGLNLFAETGKIPPENKR